MNKIYVVGIGPGDGCKMTYEARAVLESCDVIAGYTVYIDIINGMFDNKEYIVSAMKGERERCQKAVESALKGRKTAVISSGDAQVYGMASLVMELCSNIENIDVEVVPGVTAALSGGALLGAPLGHDFALISLSDLLTPWEKIEKRLRCASMADFVICIYNPSSKKRKDYLKKACNIMLEYKDKDTVCGWVRNIGRNGQEKRILTLEELREAEVDMFTTVFVGSEGTRRIKSHMVTVRGYEVKPHTP